MLMLEQDIQFGQQNLEARIKKLEDELELIHQSREAAMRGGILAASAILGLSFHRQMGIEEELRRLRESQESPESETIPG